MAIELRFLNREAFSASATSAGIGVVEIKPFTIETIAKIEFGIYQIQKAFEVAHQFQAFVFKHLIHGFLLIVEIHFVGKTATATAYHTYPQKVAVVAGNTCVRHQGVYFLFGLIAYRNGIVYCYTHIQINWLVGYCQKPFRGKCTANLYVQMKR